MERIILETNNIKTDYFLPAINKSLNELIKKEPNQKEIQQRQKLKDELIFSIDNKGTRVIDDAISIK